MKIDLIDIATDEEIDALGFDWTCMKAVPRVGDELHVWEDRLAGREGRKADLVVRKVRHDLRITVCPGDPEPVGSRSYTQTVILYVARA